MNATDFANSYMTWFGAQNGSISRIQLEAACTLHDEERDSKETYYLIAACRAEYTHSDGQLICMPNYDFRGIFGRDEYTIIRTHWVGNPDYLDDPGLDDSGGRTPVQSGLFREKWDDVKLEIRTFDNVEELESDAQIVDGTLKNVPLIGVTELHDAERRLHATLEYPVKTMNVIREPVRYQVDTGPLIVPDFASTPKLQIERFDVAHIVYNKPDKGEVILRKPKEMWKGDSGHTVIDYTELKVYSGRNRILAAG